MRRKFFDVDAATGSPIAKRDERGARRGGPLVRCFDGGRLAAAVHSLIESPKLNGFNPRHYLADVLARIADHPARHIAELLPWNWQPLHVTRAAA